ncbi:MAG TPA: sugar kinase, partial [Elusimicrobia bacterium]|nr:sugar kinase [Elusimicrobiota bacterium]
EKAELKLKSGGGPAANTVYALARMGFKTGYLGKVGKNEEGKFLIKNLSPVDTSRICFGKKSGICLVLVDGKERIIHILPNSNNTLTYEEIDLTYARKTKFLHLTSFTGDLPFQAQKRLVKKMSGGTCRLSFDPGRCYAQKGLKALLPIIEKSYIIFPSEEEVRLLTGENYKQGAKILLNHGAKIVVCTLGAKGSYILNKNEEYEIPTDKKVKVADPTGAGDVYAAGFLAGLLLNLALKKCGQLGTKLAEVSITGYGRNRYPT